MNGPARFSTLVKCAMERYRQVPVPRLPVAVACYDPNPWDNAIRCHLPVGHLVDLHEAGSGWELTRWDDRCHWAGDECWPGDGCPAETRSDESPDNEAGSARAPRPGEPV